MESWFYIWNDYDLANPNNGLNLTANPLYFQDVGSKRHTELKLEM
jgi:hypothetical protein